MVGFYICFANEHRKLLVYIKVWLTCLTAVLTNKQTLDQDKRVIHAKTTLAFSRQI